MYLYYVIKSVCEHTHQPRERFTLFQSRGLFSRHSLKSIDDRRSARFSHQRKRKKEKMKLPGLWTSTRRGRGHARGLTHASGILDHRSATKRERKRDGSARKGREISSLRATERNVEKATCAKQYGSSRFDRSVDGVAIKNDARVTLARLPGS